MQSCIDCNYLTSPHGGFSNVSSNCLPENRHSHIGCICLTFSTVRFQMRFQNVCTRSYIITLVVFICISPVCVFQCLFKALAFSRNCCICFTFLHCVFSNVSSNSSSPRGCIVTLVALWDSTSRLSDRSCLSYAPQQLLSLLQGKENHLQKIMLLHLQHLLHLMHLYHHFTSAWR